VHKLVLQTLSDPKGGQYITTITSVQQQNDCDDTQRRRCAPLHVFYGSTINGQCTDFILFDLLCTLKG